MKVVIAGSRDLGLPGTSEFEVFLAYLLFRHTCTPFSEVVSGTAKGIDKLGEEFAIRNELPVKRFPADWDRHGKAAGPIRNQAMAEYADAAIVIMNNNSRGSANMFQNMRKLKKPVVLLSLQDGKFESTSFFPNEDFWVPPAEEVLANQKNNGSVAEDYQPLWDQMDQET